MAFWCWSPTPTGVSWTLGNPVPALTLASVFDNGLFVFLPVVDPAASLSINVPCFCSGLYGFPWYYSVRHLS
jgi:hypothetical protein